MSAGRVGGVDGCPGGWIVALEDRPGVVRLQLVDHALSLLELDVDLLAIDIPIGLPDAYREGGRQCDREARQLLGRPRASSVFSAPPRPALALTDFDTPERRQFGMTLQAWHIRLKVAAIDEVMAPMRQWARDRGFSTGHQQLAEVHPELCFYALNGGRAVEASKRRASGRRRRAELLAPLGDIRALVTSRPAGVNADDVLDALAALWTARRLAGGVAVQVPSGAPDLDAHGLRMEIWY